MAKKTAEDIEIDALAAEIRQYNKEYWVDHAPTISDEAYDKKVRRLRELSPWHDVLSEMEEDSTGKKVKHAVPMLSLDKVFSPEEVVKWATAAGAWKGSSKDGLVATYKVDGLSLSLIYSHGHLMRAATRGNGTEGDDVTAAAKMIASIPHGIAYPTGQARGTDDELEVRGEVHMTDASFEAAIKKFEAQLAAGKAKEDDRPSNPRNYCTGSLKQHDPEVVRERNLSFIAHGQVGLKGTEKENFETLRGLGFHTPYFCLVAKAEHLPKVVAGIDEKRRDIGYATDGIVFGINNTELHDELGTTGHHPKYRLAFKFAREKAETKVKTILWETSRKGKLCPVLIVEPVDIGGASVERCTLHNAKKVEEEELGIGDTVLLEREVIPYYLKSTKDADPNLKLAMPKTCPSCGAKVEWDDTRTQLVCPNQGGCPAQIQDYLCYYVSKGVTNMMGVGENTIDALLAAGLAKSPADLYLLTEKTLLAKGIAAGEGQAKNIYDAIQGRKTQSLAMFLKSLGVSHLGTTLSEKVAQKFKTFYAVFTADIGDLQGVDKIGLDKAQQIKGGLINRKDIIAGLLKHVTVEDFQTQTGPLEGKSFCFSGKVVFDHGGKHYESRPEIEALAKSLGAEIKGSVGKGLTFLVAGEGSGSKSDKAKKDGIPILTGEDFAKMI